MSVEIVSTVVAAFPTSAVAERAIAEAIALGVAPGRVGRLEDGHGPVLVSVMLDEDGAPALDALRRLSSGPLVDIAAAQTIHRRVPHPGVDERNGVKLPFGGEFPRRPLGTVAPPRASHRVLEPEARARTFDEIDGGFTEAEMRIEADRCVRCPDPPCQVACPAGNDIPAFIELLSRGDVAGGFDVLRRTNTFSAVCGRVCDVDRQCEGSCVLRTGGGQAVQIGRLERYVADAARGGAASAAGVRPTATGPHIAVVGAGPAGLAAASDLADAGCQVEVIDAGAVAGGAVAWGIPEFRLPAAVLAREVDALERQGIRFRFGSELGRDLQLEELAATNAAVVLALGTQGSVSVPLPGVELEGVWQAKDLLARVKLARTGGAGVTTPVVGPRTVVIGGGNTALDAAQTLMRLRPDGAIPEVTIVYRRGEDEMPARRDEVASARSEGVEIRSWATPIAILGKNDGRVGAVRFLGTRAIRPSEGRRSQIVPIAGSDFELAADTVVFALGYRTMLPSLTGVRADKRGLIAADTRRGRTTRSNVWAVGDVVTGPKTVVHAMAAGRRAARDVLRALGRRAS